MCLDVVLIVAFHSSREFTLYDQVRLSLSAAEWPRTVSAECWMFELTSPAKIYACSQSPLGGFT